MSASTGHDDPPGHRGPAGDKIAANAIFEEHRAAAQQLQYDAEFIGRAKRAIPEPEIRTLFQDVLLRTDKGRHVLALMLTRYDWANNEIVTLREMHRRNVMADLLSILGITSHPSILKVLVEKTGRVAIDAHGREIVAARDGIEE